MKKLTITAKLKILDKYIPSITLGLGVKNDIDQFVLNASLNTNTPVKTQHYIIKKTAYYLSKEQWHIIDEQKMNSLHNKIFNDKLNKNKLNNLYSSNLPKLQENDFVLILNNYLDHTIFSKLIAKHIKLAGIILQTISLFIQKSNNKNVNPYTHILENMLGENILTTFRKSKTLDYDNFISKFLFYDEDSLLTLLNKDITRKNLDTVFVQYILLYEIIYLKNKDNEKIKNLITQLIKKNLITLKSKRLKKRNIIKL